MSYFPSQPASSSTAEWPQSLISQFPAPPTTSPQPQQSYAAPMIISLGEEYTDATLPAASSSTSSGPSSSMHSYLQLEDEDEEEYGDYDESTDDETSGSDSDDDDYTPTSPETSPSSNGQFHRRRRSQSMNNIFPSALWHAEHARLLRIQNAVMDSERAARTRELKLESEVARIKEDLAKLKQARATASGPPLASAASTSPTRPLHPAGPRGPRPRPNSASSTQSSGSTTAAAQRGSVCTQLASIPSVRSTSGGIGARDDDQDLAGEEDEATTVLSHHLTQARSARAQERQRRRLEHERMRELNMLLTLGSEVRKWEERLAWSSMAMSRAATSSDDMRISNDSSSANTDTDPDPRGKRLSRSFSLPSSRASHHHGHPATINGSRSGTSTPVSPALPSLSLSPLWRVSAEMILRRRSLSERPRRTPNPQQQQQQRMNGAKRMVVSTIEQTCVPSTSSAAQAPVPVSTPAQTQPQSTTPTSALSRPTHVLRGPRERSTQIGVSSAATTSNGTRLATTTALTTNSETLTSSRAPGMSTSAATTSLSVSITDGTSSGPISPSSGKRYSVPPPITIPSNAQFCTSTAVSSNTVEGGPKVAIVRAPRPVHPSACMTPARSTTPIKPSALKWAYTADDLAREREMEEMAKAKEAQLAKMLSSSCSESESDDSKSGSDGSSAASSSCSSQEEACEASQQRRGRARFSWRKSLPKDTNTVNGSTPVVPTVPVSVDA